MSAEMIKYCDDEQASLQARVFGGGRQIRVQAAYRPGKLETRLEDIDHACKVAASRKWTRAEVASVLRSFGCTWANGHITGCPVENRGELMIRLTVGKP